MNKTPGKRDEKDRSKSSSKQPGSHSPKFKRDVTNFALNKLKMEPGEHLRTPKVASFKHEIDDVHKKEILKKRTIMLEN